MFHPLGLLVVVHPLGLVVVEHLVAAMVVVDLEYQYQVVRTLKGYVQFVGFGIGTVTGLVHVGTYWSEDSSGWDAVAVEWYQLIGIGNLWKLGLVTGFAVRSD